jgi:hypothetical protein
LLGHILTAFQQAKGHQNTKKKQFMCLWFFCHFFLICSMTTENKIEV